MFIRLEKTLECDRWTDKWTLGTDKQMDRIAQARTAVCTASNADAL